MHNIQQAKFMSAHPFHKMILVQSQWNRIVSPPFTFKGCMVKVSYYYLVESSPANILVVLGQP